MTNTTFTDIGESLPLQVWRGGQQFVIDVEVQSKKTAGSAI